MKISQFKNFNTITAQLSIEEVIETIKSNTYQSEIMELRQLLSNGNTDKFNRLKKALPAFTFSGCFDGGRRLKYLHKYNPLIVLDIDKLQQHEIKPLLELINGDMFTYASFISPSGNGIKILVHVATHQEQHTQTFIAIQHYYEELLNVKIDESGKDITRLCFVSHDPELYFNPNANLFVRHYYQNESNTTNENGKKRSKKEYLTDDEKLFIKCQERIKAKYPTFEPGNRNNYVFELACMLNRQGVEQFIALNLIMTTYDFDSDEINSAVASAYKSSSPKNDAKTKKQRGKSAKNNNDNQEQHNSKVGCIIEFLDSAYSFRENEVTGHIEWRDVNDKHYENFTDKQLHNIWCELSIAGFKIRRDDLRAIIHSDYSPKYNPFINYFTQLPVWDGTTDYITQLANTIEVAPSALEHWQKCFKKWLVALVGCAIDKNVVNQTVLSISGKQGKGKTTWIENLMPPSLKNYILTGRITAKDKDSIVFLSDCLIINLDELDKMNNNDLNSLKSLITRPAVKLRKPYDKYSTNEPRRASFAGSTNCTNFLTDPTGNRRFLCFESLNITYNHTIKLESVYAQAYALFRGGFQFWFDADEQLELEKMNNTFIEVTKEEELFLTYFDIVNDANIEKFQKPEPTGHPIPVTNGGIKRLTATEIAAKLVEKTRIPIYCNPVEMGKMLTRLGVSEKFFRGRKTYFVYEKSYDEIEFMQRSEWKLEPQNLN